MGAPDDPPPPDDAAVAAVAARAGRAAAALRLVVDSGPDAGRSLLLPPGAHTVGTAAECSLVLADPKVSRRHLELDVDADGVRIRDLGSRNGSYHAGARFERIRVGAGARVRIGQTELRIVAGDDDATPASERDHLGALWGRSPAMRGLYAAVLAVAPADAPVLVVGEPGAGKLRCAEAIHGRSARAHGPLVVFDCAAAHAAVERELFGEVRPGAAAELVHAGAFAAADGGTLVVDEVALLPAELQPRLLRAVEQQQVKPIGAAGYRKLDVRIVATTSRDLKAEAQAERFHDDLFHRLAATTVTVPPLRQRTEDLPLILRHALGDVEVTPDALARLVGHDWPGNLRELDEVLARARARLGDGRRLDAAALDLAT